MKEIQQTQNHVIKFRLDKDFEPEAGSFFIKKGKEPKYQKGGVDVCALDRDFLLAVIRTEKE